MWDGPLRVPGCDLCVSMTGNQRLTGGIREKDLLSDETSLEILIKLTGPLPLSSCDEHLQVFPFSREKQ